MKEVKRRGQGMQCYKEKMKLKRYQKAGSGSPQRLTRLHQLEQADRNRYLESGRLFWQADGRGFLFTAKVIWKNI